MFNWFNMKKKSLPEQVLENTKNIEKLSNQELSDITQLNYKQGAENSLTYADGKATFKGKMSIIRNENTQIVDSDIEVNISSGDDDIIIDAGEDNVSLKIRLDNETRNKINRALLTPITTPNEREFVAVGINNSQEMVSESELFNGVEKIETIYDMTSYDSNINKGYTAGLTANNLTTNYQFEMLESKYKAFIIYGRLDSMSTSTRIDLAIKVGTQVAGSLICGNYATNNFAYSTYNFVVDVNSGVFKTWHAQYVVGSSQSNKDNNSEFIISKIEGVLL